MTSTPVFVEKTANPPQKQSEQPRGIRVGVGVLWIVGIAGGWTLILVGLHYLMLRLLS